MSNLPEEPWASEATCREARERIIKDYGGAQNALSQFGETGMRQLERLYAVKVIAERVKRRQTSQLS